MNYGDCPTAAETCAECDSPIETGHLCPDCSDRVSARRAPADGPEMHYPRV